jgi:hypothetical protein
MDDSTPRDADAADALAAAVTAERADDALASLPADRPARPIRCKRSRQPFGFGVGWQAMLHIAYILSWLTFIVATIWAAVIYVPGAYILWKLRMYGMLAWWVLSAITSLIMALTWLVMLSRARYIPAPYVSRRG